ncbi:MAG: hypothetical protein RSF67_05225, partial [Clostridia bacterium]
MIGGLSNLPIEEGDKIVMFILTKSDNISSIMDFSPGNYMPFCLPIEGEYNDYGWIENITYNNNVKLVEEFFDCTLEDLSSNDTFKKSFFVMFEHLDYYKEMCCMQKVYLFIPNDKYSYLHVPVTKEFLNKYDF